MSALTLPDPNSNKNHSAGPAQIDRFRNALVIDDDPIVQIVTVGALEDCGVARVSTADDGASGLQALLSAEQEFDLVIVDLHMPNMTGVDVVREFARLSYQGAVVIVSSEDDSVVQSVFNMAKLLGVNILGALRKPISTSQLYDILKREKFSQRNRNTKVLSRDQTLTALNEKQLIPYFQPKIDVESRHVTGFEILARDSFADSKAKAPFHYLEAIEKYGLSVDFLCGMIEQSAKQMEDWPAKKSELKLSFNLTPLAVQDPGLPDRLLAVVDAAGLSPQNIIFEITENHILEQTAASLEVFALMRLYRFGLSIDDFGTGATSIEQLRKFPFTELKIDGRFMLANATDEFSRLTVQTSVRLADLLGMRVVAEGVENEAAVSFAQAAGAHEVQGFHFARPMSSDAAADWLQNF